MDKPDEILTDYTYFLSASEDGEIWLRHEDAVRLGAGYIPFSDNNNFLVPELRPPHNRARANERSLTGALSIQGREDVYGTRPEKRKTKKGWLIHAQQFLAWLKNLCALQAFQDLEYPDQLEAALLAAQASQHQLPRAPAALPDSGFGPISNARIQEIADAAVKRANSERSHKSAKTGHSKEGGYGPKKNLAIAQFLEEKSKNPKLKKNKFQEDYGKKVGLSARTVGNYLLPNNIKAYREEIARQTLASPPESIA